MASGEKMRVAVMGPTGSGKSTFINLASGSNLPVSDSLESCTVDVETATFSLNGRAVTLIDTPGFDDTVLSDTDVLKSITDYLAGSYSQGTRLAGLIYMHRITDNKMGGPSRRNFHILRNLIGDDNFRNVLLVTNMWSKVEREDGEARERELASKEKFFKPALDRGAQLLRHDGSRASAHSILRRLVGRKPSILLVQDEMVNQAKDLAHTTVGTDIINTLKEQAERQATALDELCLGIEAAMLAEDEETRDILQEEARKAREKIEQIRVGLEQMVQNFATENKRLESENRRYKIDLRKQKADAENKAQLLELERGARKLAEEGKRQVEAQLAAQCRVWNGGTIGGEERQHEPQEMEHPERQRQECKHEPQETEQSVPQRQECKHEPQAMEPPMRPRQEREKQKQEMPERKGQEEGEELHREWQEYRNRRRAKMYAEHAKEQKTTRQEPKKSEEKASYGCVIQ